MTPGRRLTKVCSKCGEQDIAHFKSDTTKADGFQSICKPCKDEHNQLRKIYYRLAGSLSAYYALPPATREHYRELAKELFEAGSSVASAEAAERTRSDGFLYVIAHPRLKGVKVGRAFDPESRLRGYQTGCPERAYYLAHVSHYFEDCVAQEKRVHEELAAHRMQGEWFDVAPARAAAVIELQSPFRALK